MESPQMLVQTTLESLDWPSEAAAELGRSAHIIVYEKGSTIFRAGETADVLYVLLNGEVKLHYGNSDGDRLLVGIVRPRRTFGFVDFETGTEDAESKQLFTAVALSRCMVAIITKARGAAAVRALPPDHLVKMMRRINSDWAGFCSRFLDFLTMDVRSRLSYVITEIAEAFGIPDARGKLLSLKLSHEDFGELVGASRPMVSKHLKELARSRIFFKDNGRYILAQTDTLPAPTVVGISRSAPFKLVADRGGRNPQRLSMRPRGAASSKARMPVRRVGT